MIEKLKQENTKVGIIGIIFALATLYSLITSFDSYAWLMLGFFAYCCFARARGNLKAIEFYKQQTKN